MRTEQLSELKLSSYYDLKGSLSSLITSSPLGLSSLITSSLLGQLTILILSSSSWNADDFAGLAQAKVKGYLPLLTHLVMHCNYRIRTESSDFTLLFDGPGTWNGLISLDIRQCFKYEDDDKIINYMNEIVSKGFLPSLQKLGITCFKNRTTHWNCLEKLVLVNCEDDALGNIADAVCWGYLPVLHTLCVQDFEGYNADFVRTLSQLGVSCHRTHFSFPNLFDREECVCETRGKPNFTVESK